MTPLTLSILTGGGVVAAAVLLALAAGRLAGSCGCAEDRDGERRPDEPGCVALKHCDRVRMDIRSRVARLATAVLVLLAGPPAIHYARPDILGLAGIGIAVAGGVSVSMWFLFGLTAAHRRLAFAQRVYDDQVATGRALAPLEDQGYCLFHDFGKEGNNAHAAAGCDHLVVGPKGVFAVTVHTPRTRSQERGGVSATVTYDGRALQFGRYSDYDTIAQAGLVADTLSELISEVLSEPVAARAIVAMPGGPCGASLQRAYPWSIPSSFHLFSSTSTRGRSRNSR